MTVKYQKKNLQVASHRWKEKGNIHFYVCRQGRRERRQGALATPPPPFPGAKYFFHVKSENIKVLHVKNIYDLSAFIEQGISDKK